MLCHRKSKVVVSYASQMLTNSTPETSPSFADVDMGASAAGDKVHKIFRSAGEMIGDGEGAFRASYIGERGDELAGLTPGAMTRMKPRLLSGRAVGGVYQYVSYAEVAFICYNRWLWKDVSRLLVCG